MSLSAPALCAQTEDGATVDMDDSGWEQNVERYIDEYVSSGEPPQRISSPVINNAAVVAAEWHSAIRLADPSLRLLELELQYHF